MKKVRYLTGLFTLSKFLKQPSGHQGNHQFLDQAPYPAQQLGRIESLLEAMRVQPQVFPIDFLAQSQDLKVFVYFMEGSISFGNHISSK